MKKHLPLATNDVPCLWGGASNSVWVIWKGLGCWHPFLLHTYFCNQNDCCVCQFLVARLHFFICHNAFQYKFTKLLHEYRRTHFKIVWYAFSWNFSYFLFVCSRSGSRGASQPAALLIFSPKAASQIFVPLLKNNPLPISNRLLIGGGRVGCPRGC